MTPLQLSLTSSALGRLPPEIVNRISEFDQASWIQHVASLMADFYQLLIAMNWLDAKYVDYPPHSGSTALDLELTKELGLDRDVVSLLQQLPYVSYKHGRHRTNWGLESDFVLGGNFADFRDQRDLRQSRDPFYTDVDPQDVSVGWEDEYGQYMHPWYQPLNQLGNHGVVLLLNMKSRK